MRPREAPSTVSYSYTPQSSTTTTTPTWATPTSGYGVLKIPTNSVGLIEPGLWTVDGQAFSEPGAPSSQENFAASVSISSSEFSASAQPEAAASASANMDSSASSQPGSLKYIIIGCAAGSCIAVCLILFCFVRSCRRRSRTRLRNGIQDDSTSRTALESNMSQVPAGAGRTMIVPGRAFGGDLTTDEARASVLLRPDSIAIAPRLPPRRDTFQVQPHLTHQTTGTRSRSGSDDSEYDMVATDGSSITRTLSTRSTGSSSRGTIISSRAENPFDHPAYTVPHQSTRRVEGPSGTFTGSTYSTESSRSPVTPRTAEAYNRGDHEPWAQSSTTYSFGPVPSREPYQPFPSFPTDPRLYPSSSRQPTHQDLPQIRTTRRQSILSESTERSWSTADDEENGATFMSTPGVGVRRGTTIVRHTDSLSPIAPTPFGMGMDGRRRKEVHLPPTYGEVYGEYA